MAYCEKCGTKGLDPRTIIVDKTTNLLIGPCCYQFKNSGQTVPEKDLEYGVELSSHYGILAYVRYAGLRIEFRRTPEEISKWFQNTEQTNPPIQPTESPDQTPKEENKVLMN